MPTTSPYRLAIHGAAGRMGQRLIALAHHDPECTVAGAVENGGHPRLGEDAGAIAGVGDIGVPLSSKVAPDVDAVIDFSLPEATDKLIRSCLELGVPAVLATTGLTNAQQQRVQEAAQKIPIVWAPNMSLAVNLVMKLTQIAGEALKDHPAGADVEIVEWHHRHKEDAPSGTALKFGQIVREVMGQTSDSHGRHGRPGVRPQSEIGYHALRAGDHPGQHTIIFGMPGESIQLHVSATNRDCYAHGALSAAKYLVGKPPGLYGIADVLGL